MTTLIPLGRWRHLAWVGSLVAPLLGFGWHAKAVSPPAPQGKQIPMVIQGMLNEAAARTDASFRVQRQGEGAYFQNSEHGLSARDYNGTFEVSHGGHTWGFALRSWGRGERRESVLAGDGQGTANRLEAGRGPGITEWFVNGPLGLQHGITLEQPPRCDLIDWRHRDAATEEKCDRRAPVQLEFETQGTLRAVVLPGGRDLSLRDSLGREQIRYRGLTAYDADGKELFAAIVAQRATVEIGGGRLHGSVPCDHRSLDRVGQTHRRLTPTESHAGQVRCDRR